MFIIKCNHLKLKVFGLYLEKFFSFVEWVGIDTCTVVCTHFRELDLGLVATKSLRWCFVLFVSGGQTDDQVREPLS